MVKLSLDSRKRVIMIHPRGKKITGADSMYEICTSVRKTPTVDWT